MLIYLSISRVWTKIGCFSVVEDELEMELMVEENDEAKTSYTEMMKKFDDDYDEENNLIRCVD